VKVVYVELFMCRYDDDDDDDDDDAHMVARNMLSNY